MILKLYIKKHLFHLPRSQDDLTKTIKRKFYQRKPLVKSGITKMYRISKIESNHIKYQKNVNIFLVNLYFLLLEYGNDLVDEKDIKITLSDENIITEISKIINEKLEDLTVEKIEEKVIGYMKNKTKKGNVNANDKNPKVEFNIDWVRKMDRKIKE